MEFNALYEKYSKWGQYDSIRNIICYCHVINSITISYYGDKRFIKHVFYDGGKLYV
jgi:hypothetical protein